MMVHITESECVMRRLAWDTFELTDGEGAAKDVFDLLLDDGLGIIEAAARTMRNFPGLSNEFFIWLQS